MLGWSRRPSIRPSLRKRCSPSKSVPARVQELERYGAFVPIVGAPGAPDAAHAAAANFRLDDVGTDT
jgi:hypothetical protein